MSNQKRDVGHVSIIRPLKDLLPSNANNVLYVFYNFETTQNLTYSDTAKEHVPNFVRVKRFWSRGEKMENFIIDCKRCGRRRHYYWNDPVGDHLTYLCEPCPWDNKIVVIAHNAKAFDLHFILNRAIMLKWKPELVTNFFKIMSMKMELLAFFDTVCFLPCSMRNLFYAFGLQAIKSWYLH
jgi:hypothetical protein